MSDERLRVFETADSYILESVDRDMLVVGWGELIGGMAIFDLTSIRPESFRSFRVWTEKGMVGIKTDRR